jgi:antitoxin StbD
MSAILREVRAEGADAEPVIGGANRKPEIVILPYEPYMEMMDQLDNQAIVAVLEERLARADSEPDIPLEDAMRQLGFDPGELIAQAQANAEQPAASSS